jgi:hypothetical protein
MLTHSARLSGNWNLVFWGRLSFCLAAARRGAVKFPRFSDITSRALSACRGHVFPQKSSHGHAGVAIAPARSMGFDYLPETRYRPAPCQFICGERSFSNRPRSAFFRRSRIRHATAIPRSASVTGTSIPAGASGKSGFSRVAKTAGHLSAESGTSATQATSPWRWNDCRFALLC